MRCWSVCVGVCFSVCRLVDLFRRIGQMPGPVVEVCGFVCTTKPQYCLLNAVLCSSFRYNRTGYRVWPKCFIELKQKERFVRTVVLSIMKIALHFQRETTFNLSLEIELLSRKKNASYFQGETTFRSIGFRE